MVMILLKTSDDEEIEVESSVRQLIGSLKLIEKNDQDQEVYAIDIESQYIDFVLDYVEWLDQHLEDYETVQYTFKQQTDIDHLNEMQDLLDHLDIRYLSNQLNQYKSLLLKRSNQYYSWEEIKKHQYEDDLWLLINNCVYDVTKWIDDHPGGDSILNGAAIDSSYYFEIYHRTDNSFKKLNKYFIGYLRKEDYEKVKTETESLDSSDEFLERLKHLCPQHNML
ncbi:hypothetical protein CYY_004015 [Polysphondylium violaceum]|uniref:Cytochrome b5 heme-binding domain-containing protein n=1 Tax=Polysphondylium violaceum TaxID=133409 RepID=A0A8J4PVW6_9MYCE|nr:hypothetical protein CYY_004015 [Polysphondylium violaceum]